MEEFIIALVTAALTAIGAGVRAWVKTQLTPRRMQTLMGMARTVVSAADEVGDTFGIASEQKYEYAETALMTLGKRVGLRLKPEEANALIHAILADDHFMERATIDTGDEADHLAPAA